MVRDFYDTETADKYKSMMQSEDELKFYRADVTELVALCDPGLPVLDVGCGSGYMTAAMYELVKGEGGIVVGIDHLE